MILLNLTGINITIFIIALHLKWVATSINATLPPQLSLASLTIMNHYRIGRSMMILKKRYLNQSMT
jgi:hypothetical protein